MSGKIYILTLATISSIIFRIQGLHSVSICLLLALIYLLYKNKYKYPLIFVSITLFVYFYVNPYYFTPPPPVPSQNVIIGQIISIPKYNGTKISFELKTIDKQRVEVNYFAKTIDELNNLKTLKYGLNCSLQGNFKDPPMPKNFYSFDYKSYLASRNIFYQFSPVSLSLKNCTDNGISPFSIIQRSRQTGVQMIKDHFPDESKGIVTALIFGDRGLMDSDTLKSYQTLGIIHLLAVSGLHVGLVTSSLYFILIRLGMTKERTVDFLLVILPIYVILAGGAPSVIRASAMLVVILLSNKARLKINPLDGISVVCIVLLLINPNYIVHIGFQLSFLVSYQLIISASLILTRYSNWLIQLSVVTIQAQLISFPLIIYHFYEVSLWSIPLNLIYIPFITFFALPFSFIVFISYIIIPPVGEFFFVLYDFVIEIAHNGLQVGMKLPLSTLLFGKPPIWLVVCYYVAIGYLFYIWEKSNSILTILKASIVFFIVALVHWNLPYLTSEGEVTMIDVGQGDSIYIELPKRKAVYLIDTGGIVDFNQELVPKERVFNIGNDVLLPFLQAKGVRKINKLILTHGHYDHIGGAEAIVGKVAVETLLYGAVPLEGEIVKDLLNSFVTLGTEVVYVKQGDYWSNGNSEFLIMAPYGYEQKLNDQSIVIYATLGGLKWLFTGDLERDGEKQLIKIYPNFSVDVLKVGHHGSNTSTTSELLDRTKPSVALISVGKNNLYGHPHPETLARLENQRMMIFRTDQHGAIRYVFKGNGGGSFETVIEVP
ncbi:DNA internalization-related competence protein ComEC/Rec2 [Anaerobacillus sp. CMMVII]|uniref:DNA internalization-related competence protein ComEC/Rec2 n=1 Tax=Anaerobacillus sp. CMMVII TaxID=2755588 RepID=UPI0021B7FC90|nr:DNA internalization-related competence protein ComEC/Rec2 [Anaerobacillus sp. CMMVII]MCT8139657.1 DNA internalization-related competence protein ComEC/Rec2 [Anaerobacillus sp. CMMVII]